MISTLTVSTLPSPFSARPIGSAEPLQPSSGLPSPEAQNPRFEVDNVIHNGIEVESGI